MTILQRRAAARAERREQLRQETRQRLRQSLEVLLRGEKVLVFGSLTRPYQFHEGSDVDVALFAEPCQRSVFALAGELEEQVGCPVDVILLDRCRFKAKVLREGEVWTSSR